MLGISMACGGIDPPPTAEEQRQEIRDEGEYCCTVDGKSEDPSRCVVKAGAEYLEDFSNVDRSGRGRACGWIVNP